MMLQTIKEQLSQEHKCYEYICFLVLIIERLISECTFRGPKKKTLTVNHAHCHLHAGLRGHRCADGGGEKETTSSADREVPQMKKENEFKCNHSGKLGIKCLFYTLMRCNTCYYHSFRT